MDKTTETQGFLSIVISEIFWYSGRVTGIFYSKEKKVYKTAFMSAGEYVRYRYANSARTVRLF